MTQLEDARREVISYRRLYRLWKTNQWSATELDFGRDREDWRERLSTLQREAALWNYAMFLVGEEAVARTLTPVIDAAPEYDQKIFLTTQTVDEARHHVFFDRFLREVCDHGADTRSTLQTVEGRLTWGFRQIFDELDRVTDELRRKPRDRPLLAQTIALYHIVIEGISSRRLRGQVSGRADGLVVRVPRRGDRVVGSRPAVGCGGLHPARPRPPLHRVLRLHLGGGLCLRASFLRDEARPHRDRTGRDRPSPRQDPNDSYERRAEDLWVLIGDGVVGDDRRVPTPGSRSLEVLFRGTALSVRPEVARVFPGSVQIDLSDGPTWHIAFDRDGSASARPGAARDAAVRIEVSASDWAQIAMGRLGRRRAVVTRRMRLRGPLRAKLQLERLFR